MGRSPIRPRSLAQGQVTDSSGHGPPEDQSHEHSPRNDPESLPDDHAIYPARGEIRRSGKGGRASVRAGGDRRTLGRSLALPSDVPGREGEPPCELAGIGERSDGASPSQATFREGRASLRASWRGSENARTEPRPPKRRSGKGGRASVRAGGDRRTLGRSLALPKWLNPDHARYNPDRSASARGGVRATHGDGRVGPCVSLLVPSTLPGENEGDAISMIRPREHAPRSSKLTSSLVRDRAKPDTDAENG